MKKIDFNFFDDNNFPPKKTRDGKPLPEINTLSQLQTAIVNSKDKKLVDLKKSDLLVEVVEILEGRVVTPAQVRKFGRIELRQNGETLWWKGRPILFFGPVTLDENNRMTFKYKKLL